MHPRYLLLLAPLLLAPLAQADECDSANTQSDMNQCAGKQFKAADQELNKLYQQINQRLKDLPESKNNWSSHNGPGWPFATPNAIFRPPASKAAACIR